MIFVNMGVVGIPKYHCFSQTGINKMLPWRGIDRIDPEEKWQIGIYYIIPDHACSRSDLSPLSSCPFPNNE